VGQLGGEGETLASLVAARLEDPHGDVRRQAITALDRVGATRSCAQDLVRCLGDRDVLVREAAVVALAPVIGAAHAGPLADCLMDASQKVRSAAAKALPRLLASDPEVAVALLGHDAAVARWEAAASLGQRGQAVKHWHAALGMRLGDKEGRVKRTAIKALSDCGGAADFAPNLVRLLHDDECHEDAARALAGLGGTELEAGVPQLVEALNCRSARGRDHVVRLLVRLGSVGAEAVLPLLSSNHPGVRASAAAVLGKQGELSQQWLSHVIALVADSDALVRAAAVEAVGLICKAKALQLAEIPEPVFRALGIAVEDVEASVATAALTAVHALSIGETFAMHAGARLRGTTPSVRAAAALALIGPWGAPFADELASALSDDDPSVRSAAARALEAVGRAVGRRGGVASGLVEAMFGDPVRDVRLAACEALKSLEPKLALMAVARRCGLEAVGERWVAIVGGEAVLDSGRRCQALGALASLGHAAEPFAAVVADQLCEHDWGLRAAAADTLGALGARDFAPRLQAMQRPGLPPAVRLAAASALRRLGYTELVDDNLQEVDTAGSAWMAQDRTALCGERAEQC